MCDNIFNTSTGQPFTYLSIKTLLDVQFPTKPVNQSGCVRVFFSNRSNNMISCEHYIKYVIYYDDAIINIIQWSNETPTDFMLVLEMFSLFNFSNFNQIMHTFVRPLNIAFYFFHIS
jgi:hypothetical protein